MKRKLNAAGECPFGGKKVKTDKGAKSGDGKKKIKKVKKKDVGAVAAGENGTERKVKKLKVAKDKNGSQNENGVAGGDVPTNKLVENFRQKLNQGSVAIDVIRHFTQSIQQNPSYAVDFIRAGGTFKPLLKILTGLDKEKLTDIADLLQLIHYILLESVNYDETHADYAAKCTKTLLAEYKPTIVALLKQRSNEQLLMGGFRILKAILVVDPAAHGKDILALLDICLPEMELGKWRESAGEVESLRGVFVDFSLCFLVETGSELVRAWLSRFQLVSPLVGNLVWDSAENVILVMKTLEKYVLGSAEIDKYIYRTTFSTDVLKALVNVYEWVGPERKEIDEQVKNAVLNATEKVVLPLLTSRKYHLVPKVVDLGKVNSRHKHILLALKNSQLHKHQRKLVLKMFDVCPEVLPVVLENFGSLLKTKNLENRKFVLEIIRQPNPAEVTKHFTSADAKQVSNFVTKTTLPKTILDFITTSIEKKIATAFCMELLAVMLSQCEKYLQEVPKLKNLDQFDLKKVKFDVINQILGMFPTIDAIMAAMIHHRSDKSVSKPYIAMEHAMDILLHCIRAFPAYIESSSFVTAYRNILDPVYKSRALEHEYLPYEFKAIKVVIALEPQSIAFNSDLFPSVLKLLTKVYLNGDPPMQREATNLLIALFQNTTLFGNNPTEIEIWFQSLLAAEPQLVPELVSYLAFSFARAAERQNLPAAKDHTLVNEAFEKVRRADLDELFRRVEEEADDGHVDDDLHDESLPVADNFLIYVFHPATKKPAQFHPYLEAVALRYFHLLPHPEIVEHCAKSVEGSLGGYFTEWIVGGKARSLEEFGEASFLGRLSSRLLAKEQNVKKVVKEDLTRCDLVYLIHEVIFYASRLIELDQFDAQFASTCLFYLNHFFDLLIAAEADIPESDQKLGQVVRHIFCHRPALFQRFTIGKQSTLGSLASTVTGFVYELMKKLQSTADFAQHTVLYSNKIVNEIISASVDSGELDATLVAKLLEIFQLNERHCVNLLRHYSKLSHRKFVDGKNEKTYHYNLLTTGLNKLAGNREYFLEADTVRGLSKIYVDFIRENGNELNLEALEGALQAYLGTFSHNVGQLEEDLFQCFFESKRIGKPMVKLAAFLLERDARLEGAFLELIPGNVSKKELIYPLMNVAFRKGVFKEDSEEHKKLLGTVYNEFKSGLNKTIEKPGKAAVIYKENTVANQQLLQRCMPKNECVDFAKKKLKLDSIEVYQLKLMMEIYRKAFESCKEDAAQLRIVYSNVVNVLLQFFNILLKVNDLLKEVDKLNEIVLATFSWVKLHSNCKELHGLEFKEIIETSNWTNFCKLALKTGIDTQKSPDNPARLDERLHVLLKITAVLVDLFYADNTSPPELATLYELALSHSRFLDVILVPFQFKVKQSLVHLLLILARKNHSVMDKKHVPILLGAYGATLTETNRFILALIQHYERSGVHIHEFRPFLWGDAAIKHFSLGQESAASQQTLFRTNNAEVFSLLNREKMINTVQSFPVWRKLNANWQLPEVNFDELRNGPNVGRYPAASEIERFVEDRKQRVPPRLLEHCAGKKEVLAAIYDPAFLLPMLGYLFAPEATDVLDLAGKVGALALPFACLASTDEHMRLAAASVIVRIKGHLELSRKFIDSKFWLHMFTAVQNGLATLRGNKPPANPDNATVKRKIPKPAFLPSLFVAETVNILSDVLNELHSTLTRYFMLKDTFDFRAVPNFLVMFHSSEVKHNTHRHFILETIYNGLKTHDDFMVLRTSPVIRALLEFYGSNLSNRDLNILILNTLNSIVKIPKSCEVMLNSLGFLTWLSERIEHVESFHFETIEAFLGIISNAWYSAAIQRKEFNMKQLSRSVLIMLLKLLPLFSTRSSSKTLSRFLNLLEKTTKENPANIALIDRPVLDLMLEYFQKLFEEQFWHVRYVQVNGSATAEDCQTLGEKLLASGMDESTAYIVLTLRRFVIRWQAAQQQQQQGVVSK
uniref:Nucleolar pre-ribosomal-associated protein 1 n=1 Tax=Culex tarsalis TaxID=7177 RepID=A0A1Q3F2P7_CULTA